MSTIKTSFSRNVRGYLNAARITGAFSAKRVVRTTPSLSADPVEPIDAVFSTLAEGSDTTDQLTGFHSVTQQLLASNVLENLLQIQNEISDFQDSSYPEIENASAKAARAYQHAQKTLPGPRESASIYYFGKPIEVTTR